MMQRKKVILLLAGAAAGGAALAGISCLVTKKMLSVAIDRELPKRIKADPAKVIPREDLPQILMLQRILAKALEGLPLQMLTLTARDGTKLTGHLYRHKNPKRTIVAMHGWRSSWAKDFGMLADFLFDQGCNVLFAEQRGQGCSEGSHITFGLKERFDCLDWVHYLNEQGFDTLPLYLMGFSMGATTVMMCGGFCLPDNVKGIIADCGFTSPEAIFRHVAEKTLHLPYSRLRRSLVNAMCRNALDTVPDAFSCPQALAKCHVGVLFIHGAEDHFVPVEMTYENYKACSSPKELLIVPGADHGMSYLVETERYRRTLQKFWQNQEQ